LCKKPYTKVKEREKRRKNRKVVKTQFSGRQVKTPLFKVKSLAFFLFWRYGYRGARV
jgi:hypothetical protein